MTLLELIARASSNPQALNTTPPDYPVVLDPEPIFTGLNPRAHDPAASTLPIPVTGWEIPQPVSDRIELCKNFFTELSGKLRNPENFGKDEFLRTLKSFLHSLDGNPDPLAAGSVLASVQNCGPLAGLITEAGAVFEMWELVEALIVNGLVGSSSYRELVPRLVEKERSFSLCLCVKHASVLGPSELVPILRHFLGPPRDSMESVRKEWHERALSAIAGKKSRDPAAVLMMMAHDGFSSPELCLHYLLSSANLDEVVLSASVGKLDWRETVRLVRYLRKWVEKYERFPDASAGSGSAGCEWVPRLEDVAKCLGVVLDESFSTLVLRPEFHGELRRLEAVVGSLAAEASFCCSVANVAEKLRTEVQVSSHVAFEYNLPNGGRSQVVVMLLVQLLWCSSF